MKSGGEFSQFFFLFPVFSFTGGVESRTPPTSPHLTPPPARRKPFVATTASRPRLPSTRARRAPPPRSSTSRLLAPAAESSGPCCGRCRTRPPSPAGVVGVLSPRPGARPVAGSEAASFTLRRRGRYFPLSAPSPEDRPRSVVWDLDR